MIDNIDGRLIEELLLLYNKNNKSVHQSNRYHRLGCKLRE